MFPDETQLLRDLSERGNVDGIQQLPDLCNGNRGKMPAADSEMKLCTARASRMGEVSVARYNCPEQMA